MRAGPLFARRIDEEDVRVLEDEVVGAGVFVGAQQLLAVDAEDLNRNADRAFEIGDAGLPIARKPHPDRVFQCLTEQADSQLSREVVPDAQSPVCSAVQT